MVAHTQTKDELGWLRKKMNGSVELVCGKRKIWYNKLVDGQVVSEDQFILIYALGQSRFFQFRQKALDPLVYCAKPPKVPGFQQGTRFSDMELYM